MRRHALLRTVFALAAWAALSTAAARADDGRFERVLPVGDDTRLVVEHHVGLVVVTVWDRDEVAFDVDYDPEFYEFEVRDRGLRIHAEFTPLRGGRAAAELLVRVPTWMPVEVRGLDVDVEIEGVLAPIEVDVVGGDVFVRGGRGEVEVRSVHGGIEIQDAIAELDLSSAHDDVELHDCTGEIRVECVNGDVRMEGLSSGSVEIETTSGDVLIDGTLEPGGDYFVSTHAGDVAISLLPETDLTVTVDTFDGNVRARLDATLEEVERGKRYRMVLGTGEGRLIVESFAGDVILYDPKRGRGKRG